MLQNSMSQNYVKRPAPNMGMRDEAFFLEDVSMHFGNLAALRSVHLSIKKGEILFITGASGSGKTTLLKILSGSMLPSFGKVRSIADSNKSFFISRVFQDNRLIGDFSCRKNLEMSYDSTVYNSRKEFESDMIELCKILGIYNRLDLKVSCANGGLIQKVAIVRALLSRPNVIIADEPTSSLDYENARKVFELLNLYNVKRGLTVIWASHNSELVKKFTGRIVHLDNGKLIYSGHACFI